MPNSWIERITKGIGIPYIDDYDVHELDRCDEEGFFTFVIDAPTKKDPDRVLEYQVDVQYIGED